MPPQGQTQGLSYKDQDQDQDLGGKDQDKDKDKDNNTENIYSQVTAAKNYV